MKKSFSPYSAKAAEKKSPGLMAKVIFSLFIIIISFSMIHATEFKLFRTPQKGNVVTLTARAKIMRMVRSQGLKSYSIWRNGKLYIAMNRFKYTDSNTLKGVLPPGRYTLATLGGSLTIFLNTVYKPEKILLWGRQTALVKPRWDGNAIAISAPTAIVGSFYDGTDSMGIHIAMGKYVPGRPACLLYLSPHNIRNPGPKVFNAAGRYLGKTLVGQTLSPGVYTLTPGRGTADGIVKGQVSLIIK